MSLSRIDDSFTPMPVRVARPLIEAFARSPRCPVAHRYHARSSLPLIALFLAMHEEHDSRGLPWHRLSPDRLLAKMLEVDPDEPAFVRDLFDLTAAFYAWLAEYGVLRRDEAFPIRKRLLELALGLPS